MYLFLGLNAHQCRHLEFLLEFVHKFRQDQVLSVCQLGCKLWIHVCLVRVHKGYAILLYQGWVRASLAQVEEYENLMVVPRKHISGASKEEINIYSVLEHGPHPETVIELGLTTSFNHLVNFAFFF